MQITQAMLDVCEEALYHLRQDVTLPTLAAAPTDTGMEWVKCRKAFDYAASEVLAAHDWRFARGGGGVQDRVDSWPQNVRKVLVYCLARELSVQIAGRTEDLKNWHQLYNRLLFDAKLKDLEEDTSADAVCKEVVATLRGYFSDESKDVPRSMVSVYDRIGAVRQSSFEEVRAAHGWNNGATVAAEANLPPLARAAFVALVCHKLAVACGLPPDAIGQLAEIYELKLARARVADLEGLKSSDAVVKEVMAAVRPFFSTDQKNLPYRMLDLYERVDAVKASSFEEVKAAHEWANKAAITDGTKLPPIARQAWIALIEAKLAVPCGIPAEAVARLEEVYLDKLNRARVADLEATAESDAVVKEVLAAVRPFFASDQRNLPRRMQDFADRVAAVKDAAFKEVLAAHEWTNKQTITDGNKLPPIARAAWITLMEIKLGTACGIPQEAVAQWQNVYLAKLNQARVVDLEAQTSSDAVASEVLAGIRPYFALDQRNLPLAMTSFVNRIAAVRESAFREILAAHEWTGKQTITDGTKLPPVAYAAWIALVQQKLCVACGLGTEAVAAFETIWRAKLAEARVIDLEASESDDPVVNEVLVAILPTFSEDQKNLPHRMLALYGRVGAVKDAAFREVLAAHEWTNKQTITDGNKLPPIARAAWITLMEIKLGTACGIPQEAIAQWQNVYLQKLNEARVVDLEASKSSDPVVKEVVAAIRPFFALDQKNLPLRMLDLYERVDAVKSASFEEIKAAHDWQGKDAMESGEDLPPIARQAWIVRMRIDVGASCGVPQETLANWQGVYLQKLVQARVVDLESSEATDQVTREVLAGIRPYFSMDQKNLPMTMLSVYDRIDDVRTSAFGEILAAHNWRCKAAILGGETLPPVARAAWIALVQQKLCVACGLGTEAAAAFETIWRSKLKEARVIDLETTPVPEGLAGEVLTLVRDSFGTDETNLPMDLKTLADRVERMKPIAMKEVLSAHPWAFAMEEEQVRSGRIEEEGAGDYVFRADLPADCVKLVGVYGRDGGLLEWEIVSDVIRATGAIYRITYVREVGRLSEFSPDAYRLVVLRLAADLSKAMSMRVAKVNLHENIYRDALAEAKTRDARQSNPGPAAVWGGNYYVDRMTGRRV